MPNSTTDTKPNIAPSMEPPLDGKGVEKNLASPIATIFNWARGKIGDLLYPKDETLEKTGLAGTVQRVMTRISSFKSKIMSIFSNSDTDQNTKNNEAPATAELENKKSSTLDSQPEEVRKAYAAVEQYHRTQMDIMEGSFAKLSHEISPDKILNRDPVGTSDPENLNNLAQERLKVMKKSGKLAHPDMNDPFLKKHECSESISRVTVNSGKEITQSFMDSVQEGNFPHRRNMLGSHKRLGVAMDGPIFDQETKEYFYYVVALYKGGQSIPEKDKDGKPTKTDPVVIPDDTEPPIANDTITKYFSALDLQIKASDSKIRHYDNVKGNEAMSKEGKLEGSFQVTFENDTGKKVNYLVNRNPPRLTRLEADKSISVLFQDVLTDFEKAPDDQKTPLKANLANATNKSNETNEASEASEDIKP